MDKSNIAAFSIAFVLGAVVSYFGFSGPNSDAAPIAVEATEPQAVVVEEAAPAPATAEPAPIVDAPAAETTPAPAGTEAAAAGAPTEEVK